MAKQYVSIRVDKELVEAILARRDCNRKTVNRVMNEFIKESAELSTVPHVENFTVTRHAETHPDSDVIEDLFSPERTLTGAA